jgi:hypothetical protein
MNAAIWIFLAAAVGFLVWKTMRTYRHAAGSVADRIAAAWRGSLTVFVLAWGAMLTGGVAALDVLSNLTGDPQFAEFAESIKTLIPAQYHPFIPPAIMGIGIAARLAHNPPTPAK